MEKGKVLYHVPFNPLEIPGYNESYDYTFIGFTGGCMDSPDSPMRIPEDARELLGHWISRDEFMRNWEQYQGKVICVFPNKAALAGDVGLVKELVRVDFNWFIVLRMYVPFKEFSVPVDCIEDEVLIIDKAIY